MTFKKKDLNKAKKKKKGNKALLIKVYIYFTEVKKCFKAFKSRIFLLTPFEGTVLKTLTPR